MAVLALPTAMVLYLSGGRQYGSQTAWLEPLTCVNLLFIVSWPCRQ